MTERWSNVVAALGPDAPPLTRWWVPGRLEVFGKHTDYAGGRTLIGALPRGYAFAGRPRPSGSRAIVQVTDAKDGASTIVDTAAPSPLVRGWRRFVDVVVRRLDRNFPGAIDGADIAFESDLPRAAGMSSSSALITGVALGLIRLSGLEERAEWRAAVGTPEDLAGYLACLENGQTFKHLVGDAGVGTHGGSEDHTAMICSEDDHLQMFSFAPIVRQARASMPAGWTFVVASSGVAADKTGAALEAYNRASRSVGELLRIARLARNAAESGSLAAALAVPGAADDLRARIARDAASEWTADGLRQRLAQFISEDARVADATAAFTRHDARAVGELAAASQEDARVQLGNQIPETDALADLARRCGAFAASSFGAGFGGGVWALASSADAALFLDEWLAAYRARFPQRDKAGAFLARPGRPAAFV